MSDRNFVDVVDAIPRNAVVVVNDTRVVPARLAARKPTGGAVELFVLEGHLGGETGGAQQGWCLARSSKPIRVGAQLRIDGESSSGGQSRTSVTVVGRREDGAIQIRCTQPIGKLLSQHGEVPLPPYIVREQGAQREDEERYQTVYAQNPGAVAAPTAGLHFTEAILGQLEQRGCTIAPLTLHVGLGTFAPMRVDALKDHKMHAEWYSVPPSTGQLVCSDRPIVAVGTTVVRALESAALRARCQCAGPRVLGDNRAFYSARV